MPTTVVIAQDSTKNIDLGASAAMVISAIGGTAQVFVDYQLSSGAYSSAIKGSAGYGNPFSVAGGNPKTVSKSDLESEHVRVGARNAAIQVVY